MGNIEEDGSHRYRGFVRLIAIFDISFSLFLLGFYLLRLAVYEGSDGDMTTGLFYRYGVIKDIEPFYYFIDEMQKYYMLIWISTFIVYTVQLVMAIILLFGTCQAGPEDAARRCRRWCSSLPFIKMTIGVEAFILCQTFAKFGGLRYPALGLWTTKFIFRLLAEKVVRAHITELTSSQHMYTYGARNSYPFY